MVNLIQLTPIRIRITRARSLLLITALLLSQNSIARGTGDLGIVIERADGSVQISQSLNGAAATSASQSGAAALAASWSGPLFHLGSTGAARIGFTGIIVATVARGSHSLADFRALLP